MARLYQAEHSKPYRSSSDPLARSLQVQCTERFSMHDSVDIGMFYQLVPFRAGRGYSPHDQQHLGLKNDTDGQHLSAVKPVACASQTKQFKLRQDIEEPGNNAPQFYSPFRNDDPAVAKTHPSFDTLIY